jgi:chorismate mutase/prephenate dehydratase
MPMTRKKLDQIRLKIDSLDQAIVDALAGRQRLAQDVVEVKLEGGLPLKDEAREEQKLNDLGEYAVRVGASPNLVRRLFREVMDFTLQFEQHRVLARDNPEGDSRQRRLVVAYQGTDGAYSQLAAEQHFASTAAELECVGYETFAAMLQAVANDAADHAMLPVENTTAGSINEAYDLLAQMTLSVIGEEMLRVQHCLVGMQEAELGQIRRVYSHPQALAQSSVFLAGLPQCAVQSFTDTAMSVKRVREEGDSSHAAVASERAAALYGLKVLARNIENQKDNFTRFMVIARQPLQIDARIPCKTSLIFSTKHEQGALVRCLNLLSQRGLNLTKLESRPRLHSPFEYLFYVDFEGNLQSEPVQQALTEMAAHTNYLKVLGSYPARRV